MTRGTRTGILMRLRDEDQGIGMILVIGVTTIVTALAATAAIIAVNGMSGSRQRTAWEQSLASAEAGVDFALSKLQRAWDDAASDYPIPNTQKVGSENATFCNASPVVAPATFTSADDERTWAKAQLKSLLASNPGCVQTTSSGQWLVFKPQTELVNGQYPRSGRIYAMGWAPSVANPTAVRMIKTEYIFMPYRPVNAILTGGNLSIASSVYVSTVNGATTTLAGVHANGVVSGTGNPTVTGKVTSTGTSSFSSNNFTANAGGTVGSAPQQPIPYVDAESFYKKAGQNDANAILPGNWFDLCSDGNARPYSASGPCTSSTVSGSGTGGTSFRGWSYNSSSRVWTASRDTLSGVYFVDKADVVNGTGNAAIPNLTVVARSENADNCSTKKYGNITWDHYDMSAPMYRNLFMYADADIITTSNVNYGSGGSSGAVISGMFIAGDQVSMQTSSQSAVGSVVAADQCTTSPNVTSNEAKNLNVYFDPNSDSPFTSIVTTTLWAEIPAANQ